MFCGNCGSPMGDDVAFCPNCGAAAKKQSPAAEPVQEENVQIPVQPPVADVNNVQDNAQPETQTTPLMDLNTQGDVPLKVKKSKAPIFIGIFAVLALAAVLVFLNWAKLSSTIERTTKSPEKLQAAVYADVVAERFDEIAEFEEENGFLSSEKTDKGVDAELKLHIDEEILDLIPAQGMDLDFLSDIAIGCNISSKDELAKIVLDIILSDTSIISAEVIGNSETMEFYASVPDLNDKALYIDLEKLMEEAGAMISYPEMVTQLTEVIPETQVLEDMTLRYVDILLSSFGSVEKSSEKVVVDGVSQKLYVLKATMSEEDVLNMAKNLLNAVKEDKDIKKLIQGVEEFTGEDGLYDDLQDELEYMIEDLEDVELSEDENSLVLTTYLNDLNDIVGVSLKLITDGEEYEPVSWIHVEQGKKFASELVITDGNEELLIAGSGEIGNAKNAVYEVSFDDERLLKVELVDYVSTNKEKSGTIRIVPDGKVIDELMYGVDDGIAGLVDAAEPALELSFENTEKSNYFSIALVVGKKTLLSVSTSAEEVKPDSISIPSDYVNVEDEDDLMEWVENIDTSFVETLMDRLIQAGVPEELFGGF